MVLPQQLPQGIRFEKQEAGDYPGKEERRGFFLVELDETQKQGVVFHRVDKNLVLPLLIQILEIVLLSREHQGIGADGGDIGLRLVLRRVEHHGPGPLRQVVGAGR